MQPKGKGARQTKPASARSHRTSSPSGQPTNQTRPRRPTDYITVPGSHKKQQRRPTEHIPVPGSHKKQQRRPTEHIPVPGSHKKPGNARPAEYVAVPGSRQTAASCRSLSLSRHKGPSLMEMKSTAYGDLGVRVLPNDLAEVSS